MTGANDAPTLISGDATRSLAEDDSTPDLTATGLAFFNDVDLIDTHTYTPELTSASLSGTGSISAELNAALMSALSVVELDTSTGDGAGQYQWDFALDNSLVQSLAQDETLTAADPRAAPVAHPFDQGRVDVKVVLGAAVFAADPPDQTLHQFIRVC